MKLADVGVAKHEKEITGTMVGTSLYLAPEVFEGRIYNSKADMYSFGFVLWEIWYGEQAFQTAMKTCGVYQLEKMRQGCRPAHIEGTNHPWEIWKHVMTNCWNEDPRVRLTAKKALESFKELQEAEIRPKRKPVPLPRSRSRPLSQSKTPPSTKPKPARRPNKQGGVSVSYYKKVEAESVHFELKEKK